MRLTAADLRGATLIDVTLDDCELSGVGLHEATLTRVAVRAGRAIGADLSNASLGHVRIADVRLDDVNLRFAGLEHVVMEDTSLVEADATEATLRAVSLHRCDLTGADLTKATVEGKLDLRGSRLDALRGVAALRKVRIGTDQVVPYAVRVFAETRSRSTTERSPPRRNGHGRAPSHHYPPPPCGCPRSSCARCATTRPTPRSTATSCSCGPAASAACRRASTRGCRSATACCATSAQIVREEMDAAGAQEVTFPILQPIELWEQSGRNAAYGPMMFRVQDRRENGYAMAPTAEEVVTTLVAGEYSSYRDLPVNLYQINWKYRDELRPRFGLLRGREFLMKDAYSFDADLDGLQRSYEAMYDAYGKVFTRCGLTFRAVKAQSGEIGGDTSQEFMAVAAVGEDAFVWCEHCDYAANTEAATRRPEAPSRRSPTCRRASRCTRPTCPASTSSPTTSARPPTC